MVPPGDVSLVSKIATEQAVYPGQCWLTLGKTPISQTTQPEPTAINGYLEKKRHPTDCFKSRADYWEQVNLIPLLLVTQHSPWNPYCERKPLWLVSEISSEHSLGLGTTRLPQVGGSQLWRFPQEGGKEVTLHLQTETPGSVDSGKWPSHLVASWSCH